MWRQAKLLANIFTTSLVFNYFVAILILLLNPLVSLSAPEFITLYSNLYIFYGPVWMLLIGAIFFFVQFFAEKKYQIGILSPPTLTYFLSFTVLVATFLLYLNYDYYFQFFSSEIKSLFIKILLLNLMAIIAGIIFVVVKQLNKQWMQVPFLLILFYNLVTSFNATVVDRYPQVITSQEIPPLSHFTPRKIRVVILDGLSLNFLYSLSSEETLLNFNYLLKNGVRGRIEGYKPNFNLALLNSTLSGQAPANFRYRSDFRYKFSELPLEFDIFPRYIFFRYSSILKFIVFYKKPGVAVQDKIDSRYKRYNLETLRIIDPGYKPLYSHKKLARNGLFIHHFSDILGEPDPKYELVRKSFFIDDFLKSHIPDYKDSNIFYSIVRLEGLDIINKYFFQYSMSPIFGNIPDEQIAKYGWIIKSYYEYYDSIIGNLISTTGENELLVLISFYEYEPLPVWRRILVNLFGRQDIYVYKSLQSKGTMLLYEKNALKRDYPLETISVYDIFPTLLYYAGLQLSKDLQGEVIREIFTDDFILNNPIDIRTY